MLLGHSDDNASQDIGHLRVSYHHNWFDGTNQRNPRVRFGNPVHVYNNYYRANAGYGVASTENAGVLVEGNYFENVDDPYHLGEADSGPGSLVARNNHFVNSPHRPDRRQRRQHPVLLHPRHRDQRQVHRDGGRRRRQDHRLTAQAPVGAAFRARDGSVGGAAGRSGRARAAGTPTVGSRASPRGYAGRGPPRPRHRPGCAGAPAARRRR